MKEEHQDNSLWLRMWQNEQTDEFHQTQVNSMLTRFWHGLHLKKNSRVLVPLCGKSRDMLWLAEQGCHVIGVELSPVAVKAFFQENQLKVKKKRLGNFTLWQSGVISIWCGDYFSLRSLQLGRIDCVFDRASLTALPAEIRSRYVDQLRALMSADALIFLLTVEDIAINSNLSKYHIDAELYELYREYFHIELTHVQRCSSLNTSACGDDYHRDQKVYRIEQHTLPHPVAGY